MRDSEVDATGIERTNEIVFAGCADTAPYHVGEADEQAQGKPEAAGLKNTDWGS